MDKLSDEQLLEKFRDNLPLQKACNITYLAAQTYIRDASIFCKFRKRIGIEGCILIEEAVDAFVKEKRLVRDRTVILDTTVSPSNISYPTDITLLEKARQVLLRIIKRYNSGQKFRTYIRTARRTFLTYIKLGKKKRKTTRRVHGKMLRFVKRNLKQAREAIILAKDDIHNHCEEQIQKAEQMLDIIENLIAQQTEIHRRTRRNGSKRGVHIKDRIVSIFRDYIRPMTRGKIAVPVEFGPKILLEMRSGFIRVLRVTWDNIADSDLIKDFFDNWTGLILGADRGFHSPDNTRLAKEAGVKKCFIERKGKKPLPKSAPLKRVRSKRAAIEQKIGLSKRKYGIDRILYGRGQEGEEQWIRLGILAMNTKRALQLTV